MYACRLRDALHPFTKFTDQQCHTGALLILTHAAIQVVHCHNITRKAINV